MKNSNKFTSIILILISVDIFRKYNLYGKIYFFINSKKRVSLVSVDGVDGLGKTLITKSLKCKNFDFGANKFFYSDFLYFCEKGRFSLKKLNFKTVQVPKSRFWGKQFFFFIMFRFFFIL